MPRHRSFGLFAALSLTVAANAQRVGQPAPELTWLKTYHFDGIKQTKLSELQGSAVLLEFFERRIPACEARVPKLRSLHQRFFDRGLVVVGVTFGEEEAVEKWFQANEVTYPVAFAGIKGYDAKDVPWTVLIDPAGKVLFAGMPEKLEEKQVEAALATARPANLAAGLEEVGKLAAAGQIGASYQKAKELLAAGTLSAEAQAQAEQRVARIEAAVTAGLDGATKAIADGDFHRAFTCLDPVAKGHDGVPGADTAQKQLAAMLADKKQKREIDAGQELVRVEELQKRREYDEAYKAFKKLASSFANTRAAQAANAAALAIQKGGKLGFDRACGACQAGDKTCALHAKKKK